jgi:ATP-binding protein involved in chromosome partitioning
MAREPAAAAAVLAAGESKLGRLSARDFEELLTAASAPPGRAAARLLRRDAPYLTLQPTELVTAATSLPQMLGAREKPRTEGQKLIPIQRWGLQAMSIGFLVDADTAMIWRGPMVMGALEQMMGQVEWGALDILVVDMPPGTGDAQLTVSQRVPLAGAVIVSTPQDVALIDARRGVRMFEKVNVPVLGLIENMSFYCCPNCGHRADIFGHGGAEAEAARLGAEFLGALPIRLEIRELADAGTPITASRPECEVAAMYSAIAARIWQKLGEQPAIPPPSITSA